MPFITEEIYQALPHEKGYIMNQSFPVYKDELSFPEDEKTMEKIMDSIKAVRENRSELKVPNSKKAHITIVTAVPEMYSQAKDFLIRLAGASSVDVVTDDLKDTQGMVSIATADAKIYMTLAELVEVDKEKERIKKELQKAEKDLEFLLNKLNNEKFMSKAPQKVIDDIRSKEQKARALIQNLTDMYNSL